MFVELVILMIAHGGQNESPYVLKFQLMKVYGKYDFEFSFLIRYGIFMKHG